jgi:hypothetical protein
MLLCSPQGKSTRIDRACNRLYMAPLGHTTTPFVRSSSTVRASSGASAELEGRTLFDHERSACGQFRIAGDEVRGGVSGVTTASADVEPWLHGANVITFSAARVRPRGNSANRGTGRDARVSRVCAATFSLQELTNV